MATDLGPAQAWQKLIDGNRRFVGGTPSHPNQDVQRRTHTGTSTQEPFAVIFGCMDSRVAAELIFDRGLGDLAVVRTAGHVVDTSVLGSLEFGVAALGIPLIIVLGHDQCGAVGAALQAHRSGSMPGGYLREIVERLTPSLITARHGRSTDEVDREELMVEHVRGTVDLIAERSKVISDAISEGRLAIAGTHYQLVRGQVHLVGQLGDLGSRYPGSAVVS